MNKKPYFSSALWPGIVLGLLSTIPIINYGNLFCCLWVVGGGVLAAIVYNGETDRIVPADGAKTGLIAGLIGAVITAIGTGILWFFFRENSLAQLNEFVQMGEIDPEMVDMMAEFINNPVFVIVGSLVFYLINNAIFATLGGFITATIINKKQQQNQMPNEG